MVEQNFISWLKDRNEEIMAYEKQALSCLEHGDKTGYSKNMHERAEKLKDLDRLSKPYLKDLPEGKRRDVEDSLGGFSQGAMTALKLDSLFYMSALLYPDDYKVGEPNNLQKLIDRLDN